MYGPVGFELLMFWVVSHNPQPQHPKTQKTPNQINQKNTP